MNKPSIIIVEDHPVMRNGLAAYFAGTGRWQVAASASGIDEAKEMLSLPGAAADMALLDIQLEEAWGLDLIPWLRNEFRDKPPLVAVYSGFSDYAHVSAALGMGVQAYICKNRSEAELEAALEAALRGGRWIDPAAQRRIKTVAAAMNLLTKREADILTQVKSGLSNKQIAAKLGISRRTVENILSCVYDKTGIASRLELQKL